MYALFYVWSIYEHVDSMVPLRYFKILRIVFLYLLAHTLKYTTFLYNVLGVKMYGQARWPYICETYICFHLIIFIRLSNSLEFLVYKQRKRRKSFSYHNWYSYFSVYIVSWNHHIWKYKINVAIFSSVKLYFLKSHYMICIFCKFSRRLSFLDWYCFGLSVAWQFSFLSILSKINLCWNRLYMAMSFRKLQFATCSL